MFWCWWVGGGEGEVTEMPKLVRPPIKPGPKLNWVTKESAKNTPPFLTALVHVYET